MTDFPEPRGLPGQTAIVPSMPSPLTQHPDAPGSPTAVPVPPDAVAAVFMVLNGRGEVRAQMGREALPLPRRVSAKALRILAARLDAEAEALDRVSAGH